MPESRESREREQIEVLRSTSCTDSHLSKLQTQTTFDINIKKNINIFSHIIQEFESVFDLALLLRHGS